MTLNMTTHGTGKTLVFFHGWGFDSHIWRPLLPWLESRYQICLVDLPGFGLSSYMEWETFKSTLLSQLPAYFSVIGWSLGGLYATRLAVEEPQHIRHLINIASTPRFIKDSEWPGIDEQIFTGFYDNLAKDPKKTLAEFIRLQLNNQQVDAVNFMRPPALDGLGAGLKQLAEWDLRKQLLHFTKPACYLFGRLDAITPHQTMAVMQNHYPDFDYVMFPKAAHMPFLSHSQAFLALLESFIQ